MNKIKQLSQKGFTIVELLIVIVVIGILAGLVFVQFNNMQARARDSERKADVRLIESKLAEYTADNNSYPTTAQGLAVLSELPADALVDAKSASYTYTALPVDCVEGECTGYEVTATLEKETPAAYTRTVSE